MKHDPQAIAELALILDAEAKEPRFPTPVIALRTAELLKIGNSLAGLAVAYCNRELSEREVKRGNKLEQRVYAIGEELGVTFKTGGDPRGYVLKLMTPKTGRANTWGGAEDGWGVA